jgi:hypothetical protein
MDDPAGFRILVEIIAEAAHRPEQADIADKGAGVAMLGHELAEAEQTPAALPAQKASEAVLHRMRSAAQERADVVALSQRMDGVEIGKPRHPEPQPGRLQDRIGHFRPALRSRAG